MASMGLGADEAPMGRYPVDEIKDKTRCELHQSMKNIFMKVAVGYALSCEPGVTWHSRQIPDGYARVGVDEIVPGYESLELDIGGPKDEATLGEVLGGVILWNKKDINFPGLAPPPPSHRRSPSPPSPSRDYDDHHSASPFRSPPSGQPSSLPLAPTKLQGQKRKRTTTSGTHSSGTRQEPLPKVLSSPPKENTQLYPKEPEPKRQHPPEHVYWAKSMLNEPSQYMKNAPDDYTCTLKKQYEKRDVPQLGQQAKKSIPPPGVF
jgi:hypothetical protein